MNLRQVEVFRAVMVTGSISGAAALLNVTPPAISRMIKHLQASLGVPLFERSGARLLATSDARLLFREVDRVYAGVEHIRRTALSLKSGIGSALNVVCSPSLSLGIVPRAMRALQVQMPDVPMTLEVLPLKGLVDAIVMQQADLGIGISTADHPALTSERLGQVRVVAAVPAGHRLARRKRVTIADLADEPFIRFDPRTTQGATVDGLLLAAGIRPRTQATVRIGRAACALVEAGVGIALLDEFTAQTSRSKALVLRPVATGVHYPIFAAWNREAPLGHAAQCFKKAVAEQIRAGKGAAGG